MEKKLLIVLNKTNQIFTLVNKECANDQKEIQAYSSATLESINLTPGQYDEGCDIPDCDAEKYFDEHHMEFIDQDNNPVFCFWYNDTDQQYCYTKSGKYTDIKVIPGNVSRTATKKAIYILDDGTLQITDIY